MKRAPAVPVRQAARTQGGFTLIELMAVMLILGIVLAVAVPRITVSRTRAFPLFLQEILRQAAFTALSTRSPVRVEFREHAAVVAGKSTPYPEDVRAGSRMDVLVSEDGVARPRRLEFSVKGEAVRFMVSLFDVRPL